LLTWIFFITDFDLQTWKSGEDITPGRLMSNKEINILLNQLGLTPYLDNACTSSNTTAGTWVDGKKQV